MRCNSSFTISIDNYIVVILAFDTWYYIHHLHLILGIVLIACIRHLVLYSLPAFHTWYCIHHLHLMLAITVRPTHICLDCLSRWIYVFMSASYMQLWVTLRCNTAYSTRAFPFPHEACVLVIPLSCNLGGTFARPSASRKVASLNYLTLSDICCACSASCRHLCRCCKQRCCACELDKQWTWTLLCNMIIWRCLHSLCMHVVYACKRFRHKVCNGVVPLQLTTCFPALLK